MSLNKTHKIDLTYTHVAIRNRDDIFVGAIIDEYADERPDHALVLRRFGGVYSQMVLDTAVGAICTMEEPSPRVVCMGIAGKVIIGTLPGRLVEDVDITDRGPNHSCILRAMALIQGELYVAGMGRQVYRRNSGGQWSPIDRGVFVSRETRSEPIGFNAIGGLSEKNIIAVGMLGEIWHFDGFRWEQQDSPTNLALTCLTISSSNEVFVGGMAGILIHGLDGMWRTINHEGTNSDFWGAAWFKGKLYVSNYEGVFVLNEKELVPIRGIPSDISTAYLDSRDGVLISVGHKHLMITEDGTHWGAISGAC